MTTKQATAEIFAVLTRGNTFALTRSGKTFERGKPVRVTPEERDYLKEHAVDRVSFPNRREDGDADMPFEILQKFSFREDAAS